MDKIIINLLVGVNNIMIKNKDPKVSVLMSVYNDEKYLKQAIDSILNQTFNDFEFLIIDDGSTDDSSRIIESYSDPRIKLIKNEVNIKLSNSLNKGLALARGEYVARMDSDDISLPNRLMEQIRFMDTNKDVAICGSYIRIIGTNKIWKYPLSPEDCFGGLLFNSILAHPSVMMRRKFFIDNNFLYNPEFIRCEDYELWTRIALSGKISNINKTLVCYRLKDIDPDFYDLDKINRLKFIRRNFLSKLGINFTEQEYDLHQKISLGKKLSISELSRVNRWFNKLSNIKLDNLILQKDIRRSLIKLKWSILSPIGLAKNFLK